MEWVYIWLGILAVSLVVEFLSMELVSIWVSVGSLIAMILAFCNVPVIAQLIVFGVVTIACILGLRRVALKFFFRNKGKTNLDAIIGTNHKLIKKVNSEELGAIKINGVEWSVKSLDDEEIEVGNFVEIVSIDGNKFVVKKASINSKKIDKTQVASNDDKDNNNKQLENVENKATENTNNLKESNKKSKTKNKNNKENNK